MSKTNTTVPAIILRLASVVGGDGKLRFRLRLDNGCAAVGSTAAPYQGFEGVLSVGSERRRCSLVVLVLLLLLLDCCWGRCCAVVAENS